MARDAALKAFQDKLEADKAAAAKANAAYQSKLARDAEMAASYGTTGNRKRISRSLKLSLQLKLLLLK